MEVRPIIDTGTALEIYCDDLGRIEILGQTVCWVGIRKHHVIGGSPEEVINLKVITPMSAVPSIAAQMVTAFGGFLTQRVKSRLLYLTH